MPMIESMWPQSGPILSAPFDQSEAPDIMQWNTTGALLDALKAGDADAARSAVEIAFADEVDWFHANFKFDALENQRPSEQKEAS